MKYLPHMIEEKRVYNKIRLCIEKERMEAVREMGTLGNFWFVFYASKV